jgi:serine phosphatase RsbU (regulator of sigma subunit)
VLARLNADLLGAEVAEFKFVAVSYAVIHRHARRVEVARGGAPYPLLRRADGRVSLVKPTGSVVGAVPGATFGVESIPLEPGDALLLLSDGVEAVLAEGGVTLRGPAGGRPDEAVLTTAWCEELAHAGVEAALESLAARHGTKRAARQPLDDLTVLAIQAEK